MTCDCSLITAYRVDNQIMERKQAYADVIITKQAEKIAELQAENERLISAYFVDETIAPDGELRPTVGKLIERYETKIANLHMVITKQGERVSRQAARITELEQLYSGTKRSKKAANIKAKYRALKAYVEARND